MAGYSVKSVITLVVSLIVIGMVLPLGLIYVGNMANATAVINGTTVALTDVMDSSVLQLITVVLPIIIVVGIIIAFLRFGKK